jgi:hypothetical protein
MLSKPPKAPGGAVGTVAQPLALDQPRRFDQRRELSLAPAKSPRQGNGAHVNALGLGYHLHDAFSIFQNAPSTRDKYEITGRNLRAYQVIEQTLLHLAELQIGFGAMRPRLWTPLFWADAWKRHTAK